MRLSPRLAVVLLLACAFPIDSYSAPKGKKKGGPPAAPAPAPAPAPVEPGPDDPINALAPYIESLEPLLAINRPGGRPFLDQASGRILTLRQGIVAAGGKAPADQKALFAAAVRTCDLINAALEERGKVIGDIKASKANPVTGRLEEPARKDNLQQGLDGGSTARAVGSIVERDREREAQARAAQRAASGDQAMTSMSINRWTKRAVEWKQAIVAAYGQIQ
jgi:hypothetical protein